MWAAAASARRVGLNIGTNYRGCNYVVTLLYFLHELVKVVEGVILLSSVMTTH
jgi:hypothetical protein